VAAAEAAVVAVEAEAADQEEVRVREEASSREDAAWVQAASVSVRTAVTKRPISEACPVMSKNVPNAALP
jgi:hypothetical protein